jgi:hypothetical protein
VNEEISVGHGDGITRRDALKKTAKVIGTTVWVTPVIQVVTMRPAFAQTPSGVPSVTTSTTPGSGNGGNQPPPLTPETTSPQATTETTPPVVVTGTTSGNNVGGIQVQAPSAPGAVTVQAEELPFTGFEGDRLGTLAAGLAAGGIAALGAAKLMERRNQAGSEGDL